MTTDKIIETASRLDARSQGRKRIPISHDLLNGLIDIADAAQIIISHAESEERSLSQREDAVLTGMARAGGCVPDMQRLVVYRAVLRLCYQAVDDIPRDLFDRVRSVADAQKGAHLVLLRVKDQVRRLLPDNSTPGTVSRALNHPHGPLRGPL